MVSKKKGIAQFERRTQINLAHFRVG